MISVDHTMHTGLSLVEARMTDTFALVSDQTQQQ